MPPPSRAARTAAILIAALAGCQTSHSVYVADRISPERLHAGARSYLVGREGFAETTWSAEDLRGELTHAKSGRRLALLIRPLGDGWNLDLRCYTAEGTLDRRETGRLRDRVLQALRDEGLPAREGPF